MLTERRRAAGGLTIQILLDRNKLKAYGLTYTEVSGALQRENMDMPAGKLEQGRQEPLVRVAGKFRSVDAFDRLIVAMRGGKPIFGVRTLKIRKLL